MATGPTHVGRRAVGSAATCAIALLVAGITLGCGGKEGWSSHGSFHEDLRLICDSPDLSGAAKAEPSKRASINGRWLKKQRLTPRGRALVRRLASLAPDDRVLALAVEMQSVTQVHCELLEFYPGQEWL
jgi:hypothetical protein